MFWGRVLLPTVIVMSKDRFLITDKIDSADVRKYCVILETPTSFGTDIAIAWKARRGPMRGRPMLQVLHSNHSPRTPPGCLFNHHVASHSSNLELPFSDPPHVFD